MENLDIRLITYNVGEFLPSAHTNFTPLLQETLPDLVLVGLQEVNSQPLNMMVDNLVSEDDPWTARMRENLHLKGYAKVRSIRLVGMVLSFFCLEKHLPHIRGLEKQYTRLGLGGYWGNKGAVSIRFEIYGISVCIVNSHLAAHDHQNEARIEAYNSIVGSHTYSHPDQELILYHDYIFWMGDLNFRLEMDTFTFQEIEHHVENNQLDKLLGVDQLSAARKSGQAFGELSETLPTFPPSFKYKVGTNVFDAKRRPAWTDRILYKVNLANYDKHELELKQHSYDVHMQFMDSDHKPVTSSFSLSVFSEKLAKELLFSLYNPIVQFHLQREYYWNQDFTIVYEVKAADRKNLSTWDWICLCRVPVNVENYLTYTWAAGNPVRDGGIYEAFLEDTVFVRTGNYRLVYLSSNSKHILGVSSVFRIKSYEVPPEVAIEAREDL